MNLNKEDVINQIAEKVGCTKVAATAMLKAFAETLSESLKEDGDRVAVSGVAVFEVKHRAARAGRNPQTGAALTIAAKNVITAKASVK